MFIYHLSGIILQVCNKMRLELEPVTQKIWLTAWVIGMVLLSFSESIQLSGQRLADEFLWIFDVFSFAHRDFLLTAMAKSRGNKSRAMDGLGGF